MKRNIIYALSALVIMATLLVTSCSKGGDDPTPNPTSKPPITLPLEFTNLLFENGAHSKDVKFTATTDWSITLEETTKAAPGWLKISSMSGKAGSITLKIDVKNNTSEKERSSIAKINAGDEQYTITIKQKAGEVEEFANGGITINGKNKPLTCVAKVVLDLDLDVQEAFLFSGTYPQSAAEDSTLMMIFETFPNWCGVIQSTNMTNIDLTKKPDPSHTFKLMVIGESGFYTIEYNFENSGKVEAYYNDVTKLTIESGTISYNLTGNKVSLDINVELSDGDSIKIIYNGNVPDVYMPVKVEKIKLNKESILLNESETEKVTITEILPNNADNKEVKWISYNETVATVDQNGNITAHEAGNATICAVAKDGGGTEAQCIVKVTAAVTKVTLNESTLSLVEGKTKALIATINPSNAANKKITWESSNTAVATVADGVVTAVKAGSATITVTTEDGGHTANCVVTIVSSESGNNLKPLDPEYL